MNEITHRIGLERTTSTNDYALELIRQGQAISGTMISASEQTEGRGLDKNRWESEPGKNLLISILVQPEAIKPSDQFILNQVSSLAICDFLKSKIPSTQVCVKWPNDVYIENKKAAGILINNMISGDRILWSVIGMGININQEKFFGDAPNPVSLKMLSGINYDLNLCLQELEHYFSLWYRYVVDAENDYVHTQYLKSLYRLGQQANYLYRGSKIIASITGIGEYGRLLLRMPDGRLLACDLKEITFL